MTDRDKSSRAFYADWVDLYDLMIDWDKRLGREGPAIAGLLPPGGRVLDVACGTGRHLRWLADAGFRVAGADVSPAMLTRARAALAEHDTGPLAEWSMSDPVPAELADAGPFDLLLCLGNSFPHVIEPDAVARTLDNFYNLLAPGGRLVLGLKALALQADAGQFYLPLVRRADGQYTLHFVRFYDFRLDADPPQADFHLLIVGPTHPALADRGGVRHSVNALRAWRADALAKAVAAAGFDGPHLACDAAGADWSPDAGPDIFLHAFRPR